MTTTPDADEILKALETFHAEPLLLQTDEASIAFAVIMRALLDATMTSPSTVFLDDEHIEVREDARSFLLNTQRGSMLPFWCGVMGLPITWVTNAAKRLASRNWMRPVGGFQMKGLEANGV